MQYYAKFFRAFQITEAMGLEAAAQSLPKTKLHFITVKLTSLRLFFLKFMKIWLGETFISQKFICNWLLSNGLN